MYEIIQNNDGIPVGFIASDNGTFTEQQAKDSMLCGKLNPSKVEIDEAVATHEAIRIANQYQRHRSSEYPSFADQFDLLYHGGYDAWKASIDAIKNKYPKPTE